MAKSDDELAAAAEDALDRVLDGGVQSFREGEDQAEMLSPTELMKLREDLARRKARRNRGPIFRRIL